MRTKLLIILFTLFFIQSYSQDFGEIKLDSKLQIKYSDSLRNIGERLTGKWKYLGKKENGFLRDTLFVSFNNNQKTTVIVENGKIFELINGKKKEADYYSETTYDFKNANGFYSSEKKYLNSDIVSITTCQPIPELVYYKEKFGILFIGMAGQNFESIRELNSKKLILENGEEYQKVE
ncbi:hypothetical protein ACGK9U_08925 [Mariniflexile sp. HNIBRBA6329]|uniref:hypothetical protein n=1 Tax=Mariniflexile sp. HNIBRBA6329 TaxID=3373088 RepID=UPI003744BEBE